MTEPETTDPRITDPRTTDPQPAHDAALALDVLQRSPLHCLPGSSLHHLADWSTITVLGAGEAIAREGDPAEAMYVVVSGLVGLRLHQRERDLTIATLGPGDLLGWSWMVEPNTWQFDAVALEGTTLLRLGVDALRALIGSDPIAGVEITQVMVVMLARRLRDTRVQLLDLFAAEPAEQDRGTT